MKKPIVFWKMSGSGNDFVILDNRRGTLRGSVAALARRLCHRQFGVGADGLLLLERDRTLDFRMVYYNADGSRASMCGNGARCMAHFARARKAVGRSFRFRTDAYPVTADVRGAVVRITLADATGWLPCVSLSSRRPRGRQRGPLGESFSYRGIPAFAGMTVTGISSLNTGVPHAVVFVKDVSSVDVQKVGTFLRFHPAFGPKGTNVNFVQVIGKNRLRVRTYERGVEGETLACGTGVTASAIAAALRGLVKPPVACVVTGGDTLQVQFRRRPGDQNRPVEAVTLRGPVRLTFKGEAYV